MNDATSRERVAGDAAATVFLPILVDLPLDLSTHIVWHRFQRNTIMLMLRYSFELNENHPRGSTMDAGSRAHGII